MYVCMCIPCRLTLPPLWKMLNVVGHGIEEVAQVEVVVVEVREAVVCAPAHLGGVCSSEIQASPHLIVVELPHVVQGV